jgi:hypothetical protein
VKNYRQSSGNIFIAVQEMSNMEGGGALFQRNMHVIKGNGWLETNNIMKYKFIHMVEKMVRHIVSNDVHSCVK